MQNIASGNGGDTVQKRQGILAAMCFDNANNDVNAFLETLSGIFKHGIGFADARTTAKINLQAAALRVRRVDGMKQSIGIGALTDSIHPS